MTNKQITGEEMYEALKAAGWIETQRVPPRVDDPNDYIIVAMALRRKASCYVRLRSEWTSDGKAAYLNALNTQNWSLLSDDLKWPVEIADVMKFCS